MHYELSGYVHSEGRHCGSGSLVNLLQYAGKPLSEPMVIGLGAALGFGYFSATGFSPSRGFFTRSSDLETEFCERIGIRCTKHREEEPARAWEAVRAEVLAKRPVMLNSDIQLLKYFGSKTHFNGHKTLLVGFDDEEKVALISDTEFPSIQKEPLETLAEARASRFPPAVEGGSPWFTFEFPKELRSLPQAIREAIRKQAERLLSMEVPFGPKGMHKAAEEFPGWSRVEDAPWCARFAYQIIERRGTGGGAFRKMYAEFLGEARSIVPEIARAGLFEEMAAIASRWTELAEELKRLSELKGSLDFVRSSGLMADLAKREQRYCELALNAV
ncbi:MAG: BtrH N-terminal domain-containing protein [Bdellovibrionota bacterium]